MLVLQCLSLCILSAILLGILYLCKYLPQIAEVLHN